jgi:hypothetical protein
MCGRHHGRGNVESPPYVFSNLLFVFKSLTTGFNGRIHSGNVVRMELEVGRDWV